LRGAIGPVIVKEMLTVLPRAGWVVAALVGITVTIAPHPASAAGRTERPRASASHPARSATHAAAHPRRPAHAPAAQVLDDAEQPSRDPSAPASVEVDLGAPRPALFYLNRGGGLLHGGKDDPVENHASVLGPSRQRADIPPFAGGDRAWAEIVACVRRGYAPFAVDVATERPAHRGYSMIMVGGPPSLTRNPENVGGIAPLGDGHERQLVGLVFSDALKDDVTTVCQAILHESGHILGLDHVYACEDPMSYLSCGEQRFLEIEVPCGEAEPRSCKYRQSSAAAQSSAALLARTTGWRGGEPPPPHHVADHSQVPVVASLAELLPGDDSTGDDTGISDDSDDTGISGDSDVADVVGDDRRDRGAHQDRSPRAGGQDCASPRDPRALRRAFAASAALTVRTFPRQPGSGLIEIVVEARSDRHIVDAALRWGNRLEVVSFACGTLSRGSNPDATCARQGNVFVFHIRAGFGERSVRALALDSRNVWLVTDVASIELTP
jgi:hypothetical protein